jgi:hypothetical protein
MISLKLAAFPQRNLPRPGTCGVGDPACDLAIAWTLLTAEGRQAFRERLPVGETAWAHGRGWAFGKTLATCAHTLGNWRRPGRSRRTERLPHRHARSRRINPKDWTPRELRHSFVSLLQGRRVASDASFPGKREDAAVRDARIRPAV